jgi:hypothetical protein
MGTNCAPFLVDLFLYSYEADFTQGLLKKHEKNLARSFNFTFRYIDDVLSLHKCKFGDFVDHIYPIQLEIKNTPTKHNKYDINQKLNHFDDISLRKHFGRIGVFFYLQNNI